jgi:hypothetical protein
LQDNKDQIFESFFKSFLACLSLTIVISHLWAHWN